MEGFKNIKRMRIKYDIKIIWSQWLGMKLKKVNKKKIKKIVIKKGPNWIWNIKGRTLLYFDQLHFLSINILYIWKSNNNKKKMKR